MWLAPIAQLLALSAMAPPAEAASAVSARALPKPIATRQMKFSIPFRIEPVDDPSRQPAEVQLFVSGDRGATWDLYWKVDPSQRRFPFHAGIDGEFWFLVRTLDRSGRLWPQRPNEPELIVLVDTMPPKLQLQAEKGEAGQITARWKIDDPNAKSDGLMLQYRTTADGPWQEVAVDRGIPLAGGARRTGQVTWWPQPGSGLIQIRAEALDKAGNLAVSHDQIKLGSDTDGPTSLTAEAPSSGWTAAVSDRAVTPWSPEQPTGEIGASDRNNPAGNQGDLAEHQGHPADDHRSATRPGPGDLNPWGRSADGANAGHGFDRHADGRLATYRYPDTGASQPTYPDTRADMASDLDRRAGLEPPASSLTGTVNPPIRNQYVTPGESREGLFDTGLPPGQRPRMVNSREFQLEYDVTSAGPSGIALVELWATRDGGQSWWKLARDDDNQSPLPVKVDQEGIYGLKVMVTSGAGLGGGRPLPGELPEIVVGVDLTKPAVQITAARPGAGAESGSLIICWQADDQRLASRPVSLSFSERAGGPWTTIAGGLENSGRYAWAIDPRAPQRIYLRLEVRDEAGNVGVYEKPEPVSLDRFRPAAQIRDVRPLRESGRTPAGRYYLP